MHAHIKICVTETERQVVLFCWTLGKLHGLAWSRRPIPCGSSLPTVAVPVKGAGKWPGRPNNSVYMDRDD